jgi:hypothetical protein
LAAQADLFFRKPRQQFMLMKSIVLGGRFSLEDVICAHVREVINTTDSLGEAAEVLNPRWLLRFRESRHLGPPQRTPVIPPDDAETFFDD